ncbi:hypothetical protein [Rurimicrobium arvi]|uniref:Uncharacterized protein n=1 Tax=Rurimicrobium arvi TaxID=2049916 RepID=A0ABP8MHS4_9BACT
MKNCPLSALRDVHMLLSRLSHHVRLETIEQQYEKCRNLLSELRRRYPESESVFNNAFSEVRGSLEARDAATAQLLLLRDIDQIRTSVTQPI